MFVASVPPWSEEQEETVEQFFKYKGVRANNFATSIFATLDEVAKTLGGMEDLCPICSGSLEERDVAPCFDCGHEPSELIELQRKEHEYHRFRIFGSVIVLCDFCDADFGSYYPEFFGLKGETPADQDYPLELVDKLEEPKKARDFYCTVCKHRLAFLNFLARVRSLHAT